MVSKEVGVDSIWNDNCWFKINEGVDCDCQELLEEGLSSPCERYLIENEKKCSPYKRICKPKYRE